jgi:hypothetical protein
MHLCEYLLEVGQERLGVEVDLGHPFDRAGSIFAHGRHSTMQTD